MNVNDFAEMIAKCEGKKVELSIAQIKEVLNVERKLFKKFMGVDFYTWIKKMEFVRIDLMKKEKKK